MALFIFITRPDLFNVDGTDGRRTIIPHPVTAPVVRQIFEWFATGEYTLKDIAAKLRAETLPFGTRQVNVSSIHAILRKRIYTGEFDWKGDIFHGTYEPLVNKATWERVQDLLSARSELRHRKMVHDFTYRDCCNADTAAVRRLGRSRRTDTSTITAQNTKGSAPNRTQ